MVTAVVPSNPDPVTVTVCPPAVLPARKNVFMHFFCINNKLSESTKYKISITANKKKKGIIIKLWFSISNFYNSMLTIFNNKFKNM